MKVVIRIVLISLTVLYPLGVFFGLRYFDPRALVLLLIIIAGIRLLSIENSPLNHWLWLPLLTIIGLWTWVGQTDIGLKMYPVFVNVSFLTLFGWSLINPPSMVERFARVKQANLPVEAIPYTKKVTVVWCVFFVFNGSVSLITCFWASDEIWALYNGLIAYILMALLFSSEWLIRQRVMRTHNG